MHVSKATSKAENRGLIGFLDPVIRYFKETRAELRKVTWPSRQEAWNLTLIVAGTTVVMSIVLGGADWIFSQIMRLIVSQSWAGYIAGLVVVLGGAAAVHFSQRE
jgi:preprotein translocase subunit SecE